MRTTSLLLLGFIYIVIVVGCIRRTEKIQDTTDLFKRYEKEKDVIYVKLPPKLTRAYLRRENVSPQLLEFLKEVDHIQVFKLKNARSNVKLKERVVNDLLDFYAFNEYHEVVEIDNVNGMIQARIKELSPLYMELISSIEEPNSFCIISIRGEMETRNVNDVFEGETIKKILRLLLLLEKNIYG